MWNCFHCGLNSVVWDADFNAEDEDGVGGIIHLLHCTACGAHISYHIPDEFIEED